MKRFTVDKSLLFAVLGVVVVLYGAGCRQSDSGAREVARINWQEMQANGSLKGNLLAPDEGEKYGHLIKIGSPLKVGTADGKAVTMPVLEMKAPKITQQVFSLSGWVRYDKIQDGAYLEMWTVFPNGTSYFTRTLADSGPMGQFKGSSDWRQIELPFQMEAGPNAARPKEIVLNACFKGAGTLWVSELKVNESPRAFAQMGSAGNVWLWIGIFGGVVIGLLGTAFGMVFGLKLSRDYAVGVGIVSIIVGVLLFGCGLGAAAAREPFNLWFQIVLEGIGGIILGGAAFYRLQSVRAELEMRRMQAMDAEQ